LSTFATLTRSKTLADDTDVGADISRVVAELYTALPGVRRRIRLLGVQASGLRPAGAEQLAFLRSDSWAEVERVVDRIERRFGQGATTHASLLDRERARAGTGVRRSDAPPYNR
jgi:DNA polymerase-4